MIEIYYDTYDKMLELAEYFQDAQLGSAIARLSGMAAINRTLSHMRSRISRELRAIYYIKKARLDHGWEIVKARANSCPCGELLLVGKKNLPLHHFEARMGKTRRVSVRVLKASRRRMISGGGGILMSEKGKPRVWLDMYRRVLAMKKDKDKPQLLYGPNFMSFFDRPGVCERFQAEAEEYFSKRLEHELHARIVHKKGGGPWGYDYA